jgi:hypothetical protein
MKTNLEGMIDSDITNVLTDNENTCNLLEYFYYTQCT